MLPEQYGIPRGIITTEYDDSDVKTGGFLKKELMISD
jgi:hypothetical protein